MTCRKVAVIGYGSIGARHARLAEDLGHDVTVVSRRGAVSSGRCYGSIEAALKQQTFSHAIIANETSAHWQALDELQRLGFKGHVLVEKPLAGRAPSREELGALKMRSISVAYNLRFHPALQLLKAQVASRRVISATLLAGQDLHGWRPGRAIQQSYSSDAELGGGVLRDLSHELDLYLWLFGPWSRLTAAGGHLGPLPIAADDCWSVIATADHCPVASIQLDYYHRPGLRMLIVNTNDGTIGIDLVQHRYRDGAEERQWPVQRDDTYRAQLRAFLGQDESGALCTADEGLAVMTMIEAVEAAASAGVWIGA